MDYRSFTFPEIEVSSDFRRLLQKPGPTFTLSPTKDVVEKAFNLCKFNKNVKKPEERQRHEVFGSGPWEYILIPWEEAKKENIPQLYQLSGGTTVPIDYDPDNFDTLPRFTSSLHPLVALYYLMRMLLCPYRYAEGIRDGVLTLFREYEKSVPFYLDCPFAPRPPSPKRSHSEISSDEDEESCDCSHCSRPALDADCSSAEESEEEEEQEEQPNVPQGVAEWALHVIPTHEDALGTSERREDDRELSSKVDEVLSRLEEENQRRLQLAKPILADRLTTPSNVTVDVTSWKPVEEDTEPDEMLRVYEWLHGMDYQSFDFQEIEVSSELKRLLQGPPIAFILSPTKDIVEKAANLCKFNKNVKQPEERQGHEVFGTGPWEYILIPYEHMKEKLPRLYQFSNGTTSPLNFDINDFDTLPRLTSSLHPLVAIHYLTRRCPSPSGYSESIREGVINTVYKYRMSLPFYFDCPFAPRPPSPKRNHSEISSDPEEDEESCDCSHCSKPALDADCSSVEESEDEDEEQQEQPNVPRNVSEWVLRVVPTSGDVLGTSERGEDDEEISSKVDGVFSRLEEENQRRLQLAKPILADRCTATRKRIRRS
ncbi:hypothetical protein AAF712_002939 [Marasmius tenuissimus]|uniref:Uncharacterized protein n=1 Tax=Marasmius tenuissimus TaxID=585030 RepID=A0ABR3A9I4_9AGAR